jgi:hypothetical protein
MHSMILWTALTASAGLFGGPRVAVSTCTTGQCPNAVAAAAVTYAPAPMVYQAAAAPIYAYPTATTYTARPAVQAVYAAPTRARRMARGPVHYTYSAGTCPNGSCSRR